QGRDNAKQYFKEHPEEADELERKIKEKLMSKEMQGEDKPASKKAEVPVAPKAAEPEKKGRGGVEIFADDFEDDEA
ncbi:MAG: DNA recombination/repair protein RecA, partial [Clostridia bacterium]|nr:DNA recombination/repair protein RecA [Clostridia bacterium]